MPYTQVYRSGTAQVLGILTVLICAAALVSLALRGGTRDLLRFAGPVLAVAWVAWFGYWRPRVVLDDEGLIMRNVLRTVHVPWSAVREVHSRYGLRVDTADASYNAWAVAAPAGRDRLRGGDTEASLMVRRRLERLRGLGLVAEAGPEASPPEPRVAWELPALVSAGALALLTLTGVVLTL